MINSIEVINLSKNYKSKEAVRNISFKINENEIIGLLGPNGCGKTTTIGMILGLLKPSSGKILINGMDIEKNKISILHKINFISPYIELPKKLKVKQNLIIYGKLYNIKNLNEHINYLAEKLRLTELLNKVTDELSFPVKGCEPTKQPIFLLKAFLYSLIISTLVLPISVMIAPSFLFLEIFLKIDLYLLTGAHMIIKSAFSRYLKLLS